MFRCLTSVKAVHKNCTLLQVKSTTFPSEMQWNRGREYINKLQVESWWSHDLLQVKIVTYMITLYYLQSVVTTWDVVYMMSSAFKCYHMKTFTARQWQHANKEHKTGNTKAFRKCLPIGHNSWIFRQCCEYNKIWMFQRLSLWTRWRRPLLMAAVTWSFSGSRVSTREFSRLLAAFQTFNWNHPTLAT